MSVTSQNKKLKILIVTPLPPPDHGGVVNWARIVRNELGHRGDLELRFLNTSKLIPVIPGMQMLARLVIGVTYAPRIIFNVFRSILAIRPDILHLNSSGCLGTLRDIIILSTARLFGVPSIIHYHMQQPPAEITGYVYWKFVCLAMSLADYVIVLDKKSEARVRAALPRVNVQILPNMVEIDVIDELVRKQGARHSHDGSVVKIVFSGFVSPVKGVRELVMACSQLSQRNFELDMVGCIADPVLKRELESFADRSGNPDWLRFRGGVEHAEVLEYMLAADLVVLPSHSESAPMVIIEAMGCGKPVIGTMTGAVAEILDIGGPQECGLCVEKKNINALADALIQLIDNPQQCRHFGLLARRRAEQIYSSPISCEKLVDFWKSVAV
jgi:glycosyltransferase involved in cell wall biosynthesis